VNVGALDDRVGELDPDGALIIVASSYNGSPPDNAVAFCDWLRHGAAHDAGLAGLGYAVFGCGSRDWAATYQAVPELIDNFCSRRARPAFIRVARATPPATSTTSSSTGQPTCGPRSARRSAWTPGSWRRPASGPG
jgi:sulfite reductase alpha subunit-like flavoprotein